MECEIEFDSLNLKYKECFKKIVNCHVLNWNAFVWIMCKDLTWPTIIQAYKVPKKFKKQLLQIKSYLKELIKF